MGGGLGPGENEEGVKTYEWRLRNSHGDEKYRTGNTGGNTEVTG